MATAGTMLAGRYRLGEGLGRGGMSTVYRARDVTLERTVAVKVMSAALAERDPVSIARFEREARAAASLTHPGVATVYDTGVEAGMRFIVMELAPGRSLQTIIQEEAPLAPARAVGIAAQVADVLSVAHAAGIVHRDIKPGNVMVATNGSVKVLDFGIARAAGVATLTQAHAVVGTVAFMSPEQALGQATDARSDIYSLGCVIYAMLAAKPPFMAEVTAAVLHQHTSVAPKPLREVSSSVPAALDGLVMQMLAKDPADRPQTAAEVRDRLRATLDPTAPTAVAAAPAQPEAVEPTQVTPPAVAPYAAPRVPAPAPPTRRGSPGRGLAIASLVLLALVIGVVAAIALSPGGSSKNSGGATAPPPTSTPAGTAQSTEPSTTPPSTTSPTSSSTTTPTTTSTTTPATTTTPPATTPATTTTTAPAGTPPGHGGKPPGQAKKQAKKHGP